MKNKKGRDPKFKCYICGKYISYSDIKNKLVKVDYTADSEYTIEETVFAHLSCNNKK
jgi:hypothetical protein